MKVSTVRFPRSGRAASAFVVSLGMLLGVPVLDGCSGDGRSLSEEGPDGAAAAPSESGGAGSGGRGSQNPTDGGLADGAAGEVVDASQGGEGGGTPVTSTGGEPGSSSMSGGAAGAGGAAPGIGGAGAAGAGGATGGGGNGGGGNGGGGAASKCGNGMPDPGEECDDGNQLEDDNCALCTDRHDCLACQLDGCDPPVTPGCSRFTNADEKAACESVYSCMARTECAFEKDSPTHSGGVTFCYCGDTAIADCRGGNPKGPCRAEMDASFKKYHGDLETTDPATLHTNIGVVTYPHGAAGALWQCAQRYCYDEPSNPDFPQFVCSPKNHPKPSGAGGTSSGGTSSGGTSSGGTSSGGASSGGTGSGGTGSGGASSGGTGSGGTGSGGASSGGTSSGGTSSGGASSGGASGNGGVGGSGGAVSYCGGPRPTPVADPDVCDQCEQIFCDVPVAPGCSRYAPGSTERTQCTEVLACIRSTNCINQGNVNCYCGSAGITACKGSADAATGACKAKITAGFPPGSDAATIVNNIAQLTSPAGAALALGQCDYSQCGEATGLECIPYCQ